MHQPTGRLAAHREGSLITVIRGNGARSRVRSGPESLVYAGRATCPANKFTVIVDAMSAATNVVSLPVTEPARSNRSMTHNGFAGLMVLDLHLPQSRSLKDKRQPLRSVKQRLRDAGFSVSEVDHHEKWQRSQVAVSIVGRGSGDVENLLDAALRVFESRPDLEVSVRQRTVLAIDEYE